MARKPKQLKIPKLPPAEGTGMAGVLSKTSEVEQWKQRYIEAHKNDPKPLPRTIKQMREVFGEGEGTCEGCSNLKLYRGPQGSWFKCKVYGVAGGRATDWQSDWPACKRKA